jgi:hypothetical protein
MRVAAVSSGHCSTSSLAPASGQGQPGFCCEKKQEVRNSKRPCRVGLEWSHSVCRRPCQRTQRMFAHRTGTDSWVPRQSETLGVPPNGGPLLRLSCGLDGVTPLATGVDPVKTRGQSEPKWQVPPSAVVRWFGLWLWEGPLTPPPDPRITRQHHSNRDCNVGNAPFMANSLPGRNKSLGTICKVSMGRWATYQCGAFPGIILVF